MGADLPPRDSAYSFDEVSEAVESAHIAIEVVNPPFDASVDLDIPSLIAAGVGVGNLGPRSQTGPIVTCARWR